MHDTFVSQNNINCGNQTVQSQSPITILITKIAILMANIEIY